jgi:hypothetical protein
MQDGLDDGAGYEKDEPLCPCVSRAARAGFAGDARVPVFIPQSTRSGNGVIAEEKWHAHILRVEWSARLTARGEPT